MHTDTHTDTHRKTLHTLLVERAFRRGEFTLSSGKKSDIYLDCKKAFTPAGLEAAGELIVDEVFKQLGKFCVVDGVGGLTMGADPLAVATALAARSCDEKQGWAPFYVRKEPKKHGTEQWIEGPELAPGARVVVVEDVITTGASTIKAIERCRIHGLVPQLVVAIVDRCEENGRANILATGVPVRALFERKDFVEP